MKNVKIKAFLMAIVCLPFGKLAAQTPADAVMMKPGEVCFDVSFGYSTWNEYWEGDSLRDNGNIGTMTTTTYAGGFMLGIMDRVNILAMLPYIKNAPSAGVVADVQDFQDISVFVKALLLEKSLGKGNFKTLASVGYAAPIADYVPDAAFPIGLACPDAIFRGITQYDADMGLYARLDAAYHLRGTAALERSYYYTTQSYYGDEVDMPNALDYNATVGYITKNKKFQAEAAFNGLTTFNGFDIRRQDGVFPSNDFESMRIGLNFDYYDLLTKGLAVHLNTGYVLAGSNIGKATMITGGVSYQFQLWNSNNSTSTVVTPKID